MHLPFQLSRIGVLGLSLATVLQTHFSPGLINAAESKPDTRLYELRTYYAMPGKLEALNARFRNHTCKLFEKHGMVNLGYWVPIENKDQKLIYVIAHADRAARDASFKAFGNDPEWKKVQKETTANGEIVQKVESILMSATDYSPAIQPSHGSAERIFELRTYKASPGKRDALNARFRDHTLKLFSKHGMTHIGYWTPVAKKDVADDTLIYILAHPSAEAHAKAFAAFRADPEWIAAKTASERDGSLTLKVDSVLMKPTDYSQSR